MNDTQRILQESANRLLSDLCTRAVGDAAEQGTWPAGLWRALEETGLAAAARSEARGGSGGDIHHVYVLVKAVGAHAAPVPLPETLLAEQALDAAGLPAADGPATIAPVLRGDRLAISRRGGKIRLSGVAHRVPWARDARTLVLLADDGGQAATVRLDCPGVEAQGWNHAREPRDTLRFDDAAISPDAIGAPGAGLGHDDLYLRGALARAVAMAGALETVLRLTVNYARERVQFGRPIGKFQAVQQQIAVLATHVAASNAAVQAAIAAHASGGGDFQVAAAKTRVGQAAGIAAAIAHQVHGAMGFTHEHDLHRSTRRLWAWRDEFGSEVEWAMWLGRSAARTGGEQLWPFLTSQRHTQAEEASSL
ncbi:acyl-CoA dehydrogenase family protein [Pigmentiphaga soli]|uniref:Acyl-CoA dehydrogenase family protein n=1 Tax=Pigmentiphaga soli TaxID=1007095 RepID=A0ABP8HRW8_9BURK